MAEVSKIDGDESIVYAPSCPPPGPVPHATAPTPELNTLCCLCYNSIPSCSIKCDVVESALYDLKARHSSLSAFSKILKAEEMSYLPLYTPASQRLDYETSPAKRRKLNSPFQLSAPSRRCCGDVYWTDRVYTKQSAEVCRRAGKVWWILPSDEAYDLND